MAILHHSGHVFATAVVNQSIKFIYPRIYRVALSSATHAYLCLFRLFTLHGNNEVKEQNNVIPSKLSTNQVNELYYIVNEINPNGRKWQNQEI